LCPEILFIAVKVTSMNESNVVTSGKHIEAIGLLNNELNQYVYNNNIFWTTFFMYKKIISNTKLE